MYITTKKIAFYSHFNDKTLITNDTAIPVLFSEMLLVEKMKFLKILNNSLSIYTKEHEELFFTSFVHRD